MWGMNRGPRRQATAPLVVDHHAFGDEGMGTGNFEIEDESFLEAGFNPPNLVRRPVGRPSSG